MSRLAPNLTVTADDFGIGVETSRGIIECCRAGMVDATSAMVVTGDRLERSMELFTGDWRVNRSPRIGLHLTLTSPAGRPLVATSASGLVSRGGTFRGLGDLWLRCLARRVSVQAIRDEVHAQCDRFVKVFGFPPGHLDAHHHAHQLPLVREVVAELLREKAAGLPVRSTVEPPEVWQVGGARLRRRAIRSLGTAARQGFVSAGGRVTDGFFGVLSRKMLAAARPSLPYDAYVRSLPASGAFEMMVHPGRPDPDLAGRDTYLPERVLEWRALTATRG